MVFVKTLETLLDRVLDFAKFRYIDHITPCFLKEL